MESSEQEVRRAMRFFGQAGSKELDRAAVAGSSMKLFGAFDVFSQRLGEAFREVLMCPDVEEMLRFRDQGGEQVAGRPSVGGGGGGRWAALLFGPSKARVSSTRISEPQGGVLREVTSFGGPPKGRRA